MKKIIAFIVFISFTTFGFSQEKSTEDLPKGSWTVNKQYDEEGNLIAVDSTYSYSSYNGEVISKSEADSIIDNLKKDLPSEFVNSDLLEDFDLAAHQDIFDQIDFHAVENFLGSVESEKLEELFDEIDFDELNDLIENFDINSFDHSFIKEFIDTQDEEMQDLIQKYMKDFQLDFNQGSKKSSKKEEKPKAENPQEV